jgi:heme/copper-type cytochrome/quinol oxidase subunit 2
MHSAGSGSLIAVLTIARIAGVLVLATEALFLWTRRPARAAPEVPTQQGAVLSRFFWAATPAAILAGLALWCLTSVAPPAVKPADVIAMQGSTSTGQ